MSPHNQARFAKEMMTSAHRHQNLIKFIGAVPDHPAVIVTELMDCSLYAALDNSRASYTQLYSSNLIVFAQHPATSSYPL